MASLADTIASDEEGAKVDRSGWVDIADFKVHDLRTYAFPYELVPYMRLGQHVRAAYVRLAPHTAVYSLLVHIIPEKDYKTRFELEFVAQRKGLATHTVRTVIQSHFSADTTRILAMDWRSNVVDAISFFNEAEIYRERAKAARWQQLLDTIADLPNVAIAGGHYREVEQRFNANKRRRPDDAPPDGEADDDDAQ